MFLIKSCLSEWFKVSYEVDPNDLTVFNRLEQGYFVWLVVTKCFKYVWKHLLTKFCLVWLLVEKLHFTFKDYIKIPKNISANKLLYTHKELNWTYRLPVCDWGCWMGYRKYSDIKNSIHSETHWQTDLTKLSSTTQIMTAIIT